MLESMQSVEAVIVARHASGGQAQRLVIGPAEADAPVRGCAPAQGADQAAAPVISNDGWPYPASQDSEWRRTCTPKAPTRGPTACPAACPELSRLLHATPPLALRPPTTAPAMP